MSIHQANQAKTYSGDVGVGFRPEHFEDILSQKPELDYFEVLADNYLNSSNQGLDKLEQIRQCYPLSLHCVGLSIATASAPDLTYLNRLKTLAQHLNVDLISDHLCWTNAHGHYTHELMPFPYTDETLTFLIEKVKHIQDVLEQPIMLENVTRYVSYNNNTLDEASFFNELCQHSGCGMLLDVNNLYVNQCNLGEDIDLYLNQLEPSQVWQMHLGGFSRQPDHLLDSHSDKIDEAVWRWYKKAQLMFQQVPTIIEWDNDLPEFSILYEEMLKAKRLVQTMQRNEATSHV